MISKEQKEGRCTFVTITDTGVNHRIDDIPNQDSVGFKINSDSFVMAVSDGVGTCKKSEIGSKNAVTAVISIFDEIISGVLSINNYDVAERIIYEWMKLIDDESIDDYCATLKVVMKLNDKLLLMSIGDGLLIVSSDGMYITAPDNTYLFANQTDCLNSKVKASDFWIDEFLLDTNVPYIVFICTDGVSNGIQENQELEFVNELEKNTKSSLLKDELEGFVINISEYSRDDRTLGVIKYE